MASAIINPIINLKYLNKVSYGENFDEPEESESREEEKQVLEKGRSIGESEERLTKE